jgi:hypothetical protein
LNGLAQKSTHQVAITGLVKLRRLRSVFFTTEAVNLTPYQSAMFHFKQKYTVKKFQVTLIICVPMFFLDSSLSQGLASLICIVSPWTPEKET